MAGVLTHSARDFVVEPDEPDGHAFQIALHSSENSQENPAARAEGREPNYRGR